MLIPLVVVFGREWGATGAALAVVVSTAVFAALGDRLRSCQPQLDVAGVGEGGGRPVRVLIVSGIWPPDVGGPASHAPALATFLHDADMPCR